MPIYDCTSLHRDYFFMLVMQLACFYVEQWGCPRRWTFSVDDPQIKQAQRSKTWQYVDLAYPSAL